MTELHFTTLFPLSTLAIILAVLVYFGLGFVAAKARVTWNVPAPMPSGHVEYDKRFRVHMNTLEQLALFLPAMFLAAPVLGDAIAGGLGLVWSIGRLVYARAYYADAAKRGPGFGLTFLPTLVLLVSAAYAAVRALIG
ncbi:membrane protein [Polymorphobacter glacialis]|uniref:Membrane protein n=1 Tax=Sandarakinorhabdus glacialis TaxID=1614636 RepID=A0A916ZX33_9SPHN|nr:MAPEG family protein [Polymorphobacter glacialis]GGE17351.1 membrane protein [Polymorphobacter glacialis]